MARYFFPKSILYEKDRNYKRFKPSEGHKDLKLESFNEHISNKSKEYNQFLLAKKSNSDLWMEFVQFQDSCFLDSRQIRSSLDFKKLSILERALEKSPSDTKLLMEYIRLAEKNWSSQRLSLLLEIILRQTGNFQQVPLVQRALDFKLSLVNYDFAVTGGRNAFTKLLSDIKNMSKDIKENPQQKLCFEVSASVFVRRIFFEVCSGRKVLPFALMQALLQNYLLKGKSRLKNSKDVFEAEWNSGLPRIGTEVLEGANLLIKNIEGKLGLNRKLYSELTGEDCDDVLFEEIETFFEAVSDIENIVFIIRNFMEAMDILRPSELKQIFLWSDKIYILNDLGLESKTYLKTTSNHENLIEKVARAFISFLEKHCSNDYNKDIKTLRAEFEVECLSKFTMRMAPKNGKLKKSKKNQTIKRILMETLEDHMGEPRLWLAFYKFIKKTSSAGKRDAFLEKSVRFLANEKFEKFENFENAFNELNWKLRIRGIKRNLIDLKSENSKEVETLRANGKSEISMSTLILKAKQRNNKEGKDFRIISKFLSLLCMGHARAAIKLSLDLEELIEEKTAVELAKLIKIFARKFIFPSALLLQFFAVFSLKFCCSFGILKVLVTLRKLIYSFTFKNTYVRLEDQYHKTEGPSFLRLMPLLILQLKLFEETKEIKTLGHQIRATFERMERGHSALRSPFYWLLRLNFEINLNEKTGFYEKRVLLKLKPGQVRDISHSQSSEGFHVFLRAAKNCPWAKKIWKLGLENLKEDMSESDLKGIKNLASRCGAFD